MNKVILGGRLTDSIKSIDTKNGTEMCSFSIAVHRKGNRSEMENDTDFFNCVCFKGAAKYMLNYCGKGDYVEVVGSIQNSNYTDKDTNVKKTSTKIVVSEIDRIVSYSKSNENASTEPKISEYTNNMNIDDEDLPF